MEDNPFALAFFGLIAIHYIVACLLDFFDGPLNFYGFMYGLIGSINLIILTVYFVERICNYVSIYS